MALSRVLVAAAVLSMTLGAVRAGDRTSPFWMIVQDLSPETMFGDRRNVPKGHRDRVPNPCLRFSSKVKSLHTTS